MSPPPPRPHLLPEDPRRQSLHRDFQAQTPQLRRPQHPPQAHAHRGGEEKRKVLFRQRLQRPHTQQQRQQRARLQAHLQGDPQLPRGLPGRDKALAHADEGAAELVGGQGERPAGARGHFERRVRA